MSSFIKRAYGADDQPSTASGLRGIQVMLLLYIIDLVSCLEWDLLSRLPISAPGHGVRLSPLTNCGFCWINDDVKSEAWDYYHMFSELCTMLPYFSYRVFPPFG